MSLSHVKAKLVCALLLSYCYSTVGYDVKCFIVGSLVLDRLGQYRMEKYWHYAIRGTRTVPVPGNGEPNIRGTRTVPVPGSGEPNIQGTRMERR